MLTPRRFRARAVLALGAAFLTLAPLPAHAKSFSYDSITIDAQIRTDGSMRIREERVVSYDGSFSNAFRQIDGLGVKPTGYDYLEVHSILDDGSPLTRDDAGTLVPGTYHVFGPRIEWRYRAQDETKTFTLDYTIYGHVKRYSDVAELYWQFVEPNRGATVEAANVTIRLPGRGAGIPAPGSTIPDGQLFPSGSFPRAWAHGPLEGEVHVTDSRTVELSYPRVSDGRFVEARIAFDPALVSDVTVGSATKLPTILAEEDEAADAANRARFIAKVRNIAPGVALLGLIVLYVYSFLRYGREHRTPEVGQYFRELPADYPPAVLGWLWRWGTVTTTDLSATVLDLARNGYLTLAERSEEKGLIFKKTERETVIGFVEPQPNGTELEEYERTVITLLREVEGSEQEVTADTLMAWAKKDPARMQRRFAKFRSEVAAHAEGMNLVEKRGGRIALVILGALAVIGLSIWAIAAGSAQGDSPVDTSPVALVTLPAAVIMIFLTPILRQRSRAGSLQHRQWDAFRNFLNDFSRMKEQPPTAIVLWEHYLVYAIPLGVADQVVEAMRVHLPPDQVRTHGSFLGYSMIGGGFHDMNTFTTSVSNISTSFTASASAAFSTAPASSSGGGGGSSGGGGGGGGGGSSGMS